MKVHVSRETARLFWGANVGLLIAVAAMSVAVDGNGNLPYLGWTWSLPVIIALFTAAGLLDAILMVLSKPGRWAAAAILVFYVALLLPAIL